MAIRSARFHIAAYSLSAFLTAFSFAARAANDCREAFVADLRQQTTPIVEKPLALTVSGIAGVEVKVAARNFKDSEKIRELINQTELPLTFRPGDWRVDISAKSLAAQGIPSELPDKQITSSQIIDSLQRSLPRELKDDLVAYVQEVLDDARSRSFSFQYFSIAIRTELYGSATEGHTHFYGNISLDYARALIGPNTEIEVNAEMRPTSAPVIYASTSRSSEVVVFGNAWHRSPKTLPGEKRLWINITLGNDG